MVFDPIARSYHYSLFLFATLALKSEEMTSDRLRTLDEKIAALFREGSPISADAEPLPAPSVDQPNIIETAGPGENTATMADQPRSMLDGLNLDTAIRLRWVLRDIKGKRTKLTPVSPGDLRTLIEMGFIEMRDEVPVLTNEGERAVNWN